MVPYYGVPLGLTTKRHHKSTTLFILYVCSMAQAKSMVFLILEILKYKLRHLPPFLVICMFMLRHLPPCLRPVTPLTVTGWYLMTVVMVIVPVPWCMICDHCLLKGDVWSAIVSRTQLLSYMYELNALRSLKLTVGYFRYDDLRSSYLRDINSHVADKKVSCVEIRFSEAENQRLRRVTSSIEAYIFFNFRWSFHAFITHIYKRCKPAWFMVRIILDKWFSSHKLTVTTKWHHLHAGA